MRTLINRRNLWGGVYHCAMDSMDIRVINHNHEAINAIDGPVDEPEAMVMRISMRYAPTLAEFGFALIPACIYYVKPPTETYFS